MKRLIMVACIGVACIDLGTLAGVALAQPLSGTTGQDDSPRPVKSVAPPAWNASDPAPPPPLPVAPGGECASSAATDAGRRLAGRDSGIARIAGSRVSPHAIAGRGGIGPSGSRCPRASTARGGWNRNAGSAFPTICPSASVDPYDGDYAAYWASNYPTIRSAGSEAASRGVL